MTSVLTYSPMSDPFASHAAAQAEAQAAQSHRYAQSTPPLAVVAAATQGRVSQRTTPSGSPKPPGVTEFGTVAPGSSQPTGSGNRHRVSLGHGQGYTPPNPVASTSATTAHAYYYPSSHAQALPVAPVSAHAHSQSTHPAQTMAQVTPPNANARKRASHNPSSTLAHAQASPPKPEHLTDEYVLHPSVYEYKAEHPKKPMVGFGPYVLLRTLGTGEFGKVKLGVHTDYGVEVAIKLIRRGSLHDEVMANKVEREIDVLKTLKHPNIVRMFDVIDTEKYIGIVIEFAAGGELFDYILANRHLKDRDAQKLFAQLISGVDYLHKKNIIHRDLKLENLLLDKHRNIIITDFGFANRFESGQADLMATSCGSPCYAAPELVVTEGEYAGSAVDIWSCGVILYAMLAGYLPFDDDPDNPDGDNINLLYKYIVNTPVHFPPHVSQQARDLLSIMIVPDPAYRATMMDIITHPWLANHTALFERTVEMNEWIFQDQMYKKSQAAKRELNERKRVQREAQMASFRQVQRSQSTMPGTSLDRRKHQSALVGSATISENLASGQRTPPLATIAQNLTSVPAPIPAPPVMAPALTPNPSDGRSTMAVENESVSAPAAAGGASSASLPLASVPLNDAEPTDRPQNKNRHTIQVEYDGEASYERMQEAMSRREVSATGTSVDSDRIHIPVASMSDVEASESEMGHVAESTLESVDSRVSPVGSPSQASPASPPKSPRSPQQPTTPKRRTPTETVGSPSTPRASMAIQPEEMATPKAKAPSSPKGKGKEKFDTLPARPTSTAPIPIPSNVPGPKPQRQRKGMSLDKFGLAKLLGTGSSVDLARKDADTTAAKVSTAPGAMGPPALPSVREQRRMSSRPATAMSQNQGEDKKSKRKTLQLMVSRSSSIRDKNRSPVPLSARDMNPASAPPHITTAHATARAAGTAQENVPQSGVPTSPSVTTVDGLAKADKSATASSSAAKKVMDWFRRKSIAKETTLQGMRSRNESDGSFVRVEPNLVAPSETSSIGGTAEGGETSASVTAPAPATTTAPAPAVSAATAKAEPTLAPPEREALVPSPLPEPTRQPLAEGDSANVLRVSPPRATPTRSKSHGVPGGAPVSLAQAASSEDYKMRIHTGVLDQSALSSKPPQEVMAEVIRVLIEMGMDVKRENEYRVRCTRVKKKGRGFGSVISIAGGVMSGSSRLDSRGLPLPSSPSSQSILSPGGIRGMLRRGSTGPGSVSLSRSPSDVVGLGLSSPPPSSAGTVYSPALPSATFEPIYGEHSVDSGDEVRFNVELCRMKNLPGLYLLNIKRLRGSVWSFKFIYQTVIDRCETLTH